MFKTVVQNGKQHPRGVDIPRVLSPLLRELK